MIKQVDLYSKKPGMSANELKTYYETRHTPLAAKHLRMIVGYRRSYMVPGSTFDAGHIADAPPPPEIDVMTEMWFRTQADMDALTAALADPTLGAMFAEDEAQLFDRGSIQMFMVDERVTTETTLKTAARAKGYQ